MKLSIKKEICVPVIENTFVASNEQEIVTVKHKIPLDTIELVMDDGRVFSLSQLIQTFIDNMHNE